MLPARIGNAVSILPDECNAVGSGFILSDNVTVIVTYEGAQRGGAQ